MRPLALVLGLAATVGCASPGSSSLAVDGSWVRVFAAEPGPLFDAVVAVLAGDGYQIQRANRNGGSLSARSPVATTTWPLYGEVLRYTLARVDLENLADGHVQLRLGLVETYEPSGAGRSPNNDRPVDSRATYERFFDKVAARLAETGSGGPRVTAGPAAQGPGRGAPA